MSKKLNDESMSLRVNAADKKRFINACAKIEKPPQQMLREMMAALAAGRLQIIVDETEEKRGPYVYRK